VVEVLAVVVEELDDPPAVVVVVAAAGSTQAGRSRVRVCVVTWGGVGAPDGSGGEATVTGTRRARPGFPGLSQRSS
jgi:hypothetical protein